MLSNERRIIGLIGSKIEDKLASISWTIPDKEKEVDGTYTLDEYKVDKIKEGVEESKELCKALLGYLTMDEEKGQLESDHWSQTADINRLNKKNEKLMDEVTSLRQKVLELEAPQEERDYDLEARAMEEGMDPITENDFAYYMDKAEAMRKGED